MNDEIGYAASPRRLKCVRQAIPFSRRNDKWLSLAFLPQRPAILHRLYSPDLHPSRVVQELAVLDRCVVFYPTPLHILCEVTASGAEPLGGICIPLNGDVRINMPCAPNREEGRLWAVVDMAYG